MSIKATALDDVITAVVAALQSANLGYPVFDGPPTNRPVRGINRYVCIGLEELPPDDKTEVNIGTSDQTWYGLGQRAKEEHVNIECVAVGKATSAATARALATGVIQSVSDNLVALKTNPNTTETYNALVSAVPGARVRDEPGGTVIVMQFTITAIARLT
jgi:hypothetical protein